MRRLISDESGATAIIVALLLVVLVGLTAFVVDVGDVMWERRMLQNGADAAALAVAIDCAQGDCKDFQGTADDYATDNNVRGAFVQSVTGPDGGVPTFAGGSVTVVTRTGDNSGEGRLRQWFSGVLGREEGLATGATATAIWGVPDLTTSASPLTISICSFQRLTGITNWPPTTADISGLPTWEDVRDGTADPAGEQTIFYKDGPKQDELLDEACKAPPGFYSDPDAEEGEDDKLPAAFGWLDSTSCEVTVSTELDGSQWAPATPGASAGGEVACIKDLVTQTPPVAVFPIFVGVREDNKGTPQEYQIVAPAAFYITGYRLPGGGQPTFPAGDAPCRANEGTCIRGQFVKKLDDGNPTDSTSFGLLSVRLSE